MVQNDDSFQVDVFLAGVPKAASTWIYRCFEEHPGIAVPTSDSLRYFDIKYHKGSDWYKSFFENVKPGQIVVDPSPTYLRSQCAAERIAKDHPNTRFLVSLRDPVERAFSHFWHEKKERKFVYEFHECMHHFILYNWFIETGFYAMQLDNYFRYFDRGRFLIVLFDDLKKDPDTFIRRIFKFMDVDPDFRPSILHKKINVAGVEVNTLTKMLRQLKRNRYVSMMANPVQNALFGRSGYGKRFSIMASDKGYRQGMDMEVRAELLSIYLPHIERLEDLLGVNLAAWKG